MTFQISTWDVPSLRRALLRLQTARMTRLWGCWAGAPTVIPITSGRGCPVSPGMAEGQAAQTTARQGGCGVMGIGGSTDGEAPHASGKWGPGPGVYGMGGAGLSTAHGAGVIGDSGISDLEGCRRWCRGAVPAVGRRDPEYRRLRKVTERTGCGRLFDRRPRRSIFLQPSRRPVSSAIAVDSPAWNFRGLDSCSAQERPTG